MISCLSTRTILLALILILSVMALSILPVSAISASTTRIDINSEPGTTVTVPISLTLSPNEPEDTIVIDVKGLGQSSADGSFQAIEPASDTGPYTARPFIMIDQPAVSIGQDTPAEVTASITIPADEKNGTRFALIQVHATGNPAVAANTVSIPVFLTIKGGSILESGEITALAFTTAEQGDDLQVTTLFTNTGNYPLSGIISNVTITDAKGSVLTRAYSLPSEWEHLPGQEVQYSVTLPEGLPEDAHMLTTRIEKLEGTFLAEKNELLKEQAADNSPASLPGFGMGIVCIAIAAGFLRERSHRRR